MTVLLYFLCDVTCYVCFKNKAEEQRFVNCNGKFVSFVLPVVQVNAPVRLCDIQNAYNIKPYFVAVATCRSVNIENNL